MGPVMRSGCTAKHSDEARRGKRSFQSRMNRSIGSWGWGLCSLAYTASLHSDQVLWRRVVRRYQSCTVAWVAKANDGIWMTFRASWDGLWHIRALAPRE